MGQNTDKILPNSGQGSAGPELAGGGKGGSSIGTPQKNTGGTKK